MIRKELKCYMEKGQYGYMNWKKKRTIIKSLIWIAVVAALVIPGKLIDNMAGAACLILGIVFVLPAARVWVECLILLPYKTPSKDEIEYYEDIGNYFEDSIILYDLAIAMRNKVKFVPICIITNGKMYDTKEKIQGLEKQKKTQQYASDLRKEANEEIASNILAECI